ncbi:MAG: S8 family serine peptidase [Pseudomonadota bacterium]
MTSADNNPALTPPAPTPTGNMLVLMRPNIKTTTAAKRLTDASGLKVAVARDYAKSAATAGSGLPDADCYFMDDLNIAVLKSADSEKAAALASTLEADDDVRMVRPEFYMYTLNTMQQRYDSWVRDGLRILADGAPQGQRAPVSGATAAAQFMDDASATWGIKAIKADQSPYSGRGIQVAVLDTGFDSDHPDFTGRSVTSASFVPGQSAEDVQGHGTHCIGTACGPGATSQHPRYGVAGDAEIFVGKVLGNDGRGAESWILNGMNWAVRNKCEVISMSLGRPTRLNEPHDLMYEAAGEAALEAGSLIIAAAGNDSIRRWWWVAPVGAPANSPSIMAVGAVDSDMNVASFSNGGRNPNGGEVNIAGPGVDIFSSYPMSRRYRTIDGTSMACPHVAGVAALLAESDPALRGQKLWDALRRSARDIGLPMRDGGAGLVQAPGSAGGGGLIA